MSEPTVQNCSQSEKGDSDEARVCPLIAKKAGEHVQKANKRLVQGSALFKEIPVLPEINKADMLALGEDLGHGGFNRVSAAVIRKESGKEEVAIKYLRHSVMLNLNRFRHGVADLLTEASLLNVLDHPNIVKFHGIAAGSPKENVASGGDRAFFIAVERLHDTLYRRMKGWDKATEPYTFISNKRASFFKKKNEQLMERLQVAAELASAMEYLHSLRIVFRDLKPDNVGFDEDGNVKLFDFGLAKELKYSDLTLDGRYRMSGDTGTRRYMAPEVSKDLPYHLSVDVYSFGILLWEMLTGERAYYGYGCAKHFERVVLQHERPSLAKRLTGAWPIKLTELLPRCWAVNPRERPSFEDIRKTLEEIMGSISQVQNNSYEKPQHRRRLSWNRVQLGRLKVDYERAKSNKDLVQTNVFFQASVCH